MKPAILILVLAAVVSLVAGCVSKSKAEAQARAAYLAGQQQALSSMRQQPGQGGSITFNGPVRQQNVPWTPATTLTSALLAADYFGPDPVEFLIVRAGRLIRVSPAELLTGKDVQLLAGDVVQIQTSQSLPGPVTR